MSCAARGSAATGQVDSGQRGGGSMWDDAGFESPSLRNSSGSPRQSGLRGARAQSGANAWDSDYDENARESSRDGLHRNGRHSARSTSSTDSGLGNSDGFGDRQQPSYDDVWNDSDGDQFEERGVRSRNDGRGRAATPENSGDFSGDFGGDFGGDEVSSQWEQWQQGNSLNSEPKTGVDDLQTQDERGGKSADRVVSNVWDDFQGEYADDRDGEGLRRDGRKAAANAWDEFDSIDEFDKFDKRSSDFPAGDAKRAQRGSSAQGFDSEFSDFDVQFGGSDPWGADSNDFESFSHGGERKVSEDSNAWNPDAHRGGHRGGIQRNTNRHGNREDRTERAPAGDAFAEDDWLSGGGFDESALADSAAAPPQFTGWGDNGSAGIPLTHKRGEGKEPSSPGVSDSDSGPKEEQWSGSSLLGAP